VIFFGKEISTITSEWFGNFLSALLNLKYSSAETLRKNR
jgi:hypothetical protein